VNSNFQSTLGSRRRNGLTECIEGRFQLETRIGIGAFGKVYRARDITSGEPVAVKIFNANIRDAGYLQELGLLFAEEHPHIVPTLSFGYASGEKYLVYRFMAGGSLRDVLARTPRPPLDHALSICRDILDGLAFAHARRVVHRDIKPENVLLDGARWPFSASLCDFGLSARLIEGESNASNFGSPAYMAPEQFGEHYDHRVDLYAVGVMLYEMLYGRRPFDGDATELRYAHTHRDMHVPSSTPISLAQFLRKLAARDPEKRFATAGDALAALDSVRTTLDESRVERTVQLRDPAAITTRWRARIAARCESVEALAADGLVLSFRDRIARLGADGGLDPIADASEAVHEIAAQTGPSDLLAWMSGDQIWTARHNDVQPLPGDYALPAHPRRLVLSPGGEWGLVASSESIDLIRMHDGEHMWRAEVDGYGSVPEVTFAGGDDTVVWICTESPRTVLVCMDVDGQILARTSIGTADTSIIGRPDGGCVVAGRGRRSITHYDREGFVVAEGITGAPVQELVRYDDRHLAVWSVRHAELIVEDSLDTRAFVRRPDTHELVVPIGRGGYLVGPDEADDDAVVVRRFTLDVITEVLS